jgi:membrane associated rhomboid family serine protease
LDYWQHGITVRQHLNRKKRRPALAFFAAWVPWAIFVFFAGEHPPVWAVAMAVIAFLTGMMSVLYLLLALGVRAADTTWGTRSHTLAVHSRFPRSFSFVPTAALSLIPL